ncbi:MAG TPA: hypothetical protein VGK35_06275 [Actinotalea sp.]
MASHESPTTWHDERAVRITGGRGLEAVVVPERGAKIASLRDGSGQEWLAQPGPELPPPARGPVRFTDAEMCGWDECAPNVDPDELAGEALADHGEVWSKPWTREVEGGFGSAGTVLPYELARDIVPTSGGLRLEYRATATGDERVPFMWAAHPQFSAGTGARILLPPQVQQVRGVYGVDARQEWSEQLWDVDALPDGEALKFWAEDDALPAWAVLERSDGSRLRLSWDPDLVPYLALWVDAGLFSRERVVALEPSTGGREALSRALADGCAQHLEPGRRVSWWIDLEVTPPA